MAYNVIQNIVFAEAPLYFVRSGVIGRVKQTGPSTWSPIPIADSGQDGYDWSSLAYRYSMRAYSLSFYSRGVTPSYDDAAGYYENAGLPLRCLAS